VRACARTQLEHLAKGHHKVVEELLLIQNVLLVNSNGRIVPGAPQKSLVHIDYLLEQPPAFSNCTAAYGGATVGVGN